MKRLLAVSLALNGLVAVGVLVGAMFWLGLVRPEAVGHAERGGGAGTPSGNGDVNGDEAINITDAVYILNFLFLGGPAPEPIVCPPPRGGALPATGQTECYGYEELRSWVAVPCEGAEIPGQDGAYQAGCPMEGRFVDHGDGTVTDMCTGLMWQKDTADVNGDGTIDPEWGGTDTLTWRDALAYCEDLSFAGHDDWRLPNVRELQSIVDYGRWDPAINPVFGALSRSYWSSSTYARYPGIAWYVSFHVGVVASDGDKVYLSHVRAVRRGP